MGMDQVKNFIFAYLPSVSLCLVLIVATIQNRYSSLGNHHQNLGLVPYLVDVVVRHAGVILPFPMLLLQQMILSHEEIRKLEIIRKEPPAPFPCLPKSWRWLGLPRTWIWGVMILWLALVALRWLLFIPLREYHLDFSDHIFLITCIIAQLQTKIFLLHHTLHSMDGEKKEDGETCCCMSVKARAWVLLGTTWVLIVVLFVEAFFTAKFFHSVKADWLSFVAGTVVFGGCTGYWMWKTATMSREDYDSMSCAELTEEPGSDLEKPWSRDKV